MSNEHNGQGMFPEPTEVERLLHQMATAFPENDRSEHDLDVLGDGEIMSVRSYPRSMVAEAREPQEYLTGEVLQARHEFPVCPFCGQRHPQGRMALVLIFDTDTGGF